MLSREAKNLQAVPVRHSVFEVDITLDGTRSRRRPQPIQRPVIRRQVIEFDPSTERDCFEDENFYPDYCVLTDGESQSDEVPSTAQDVPAESSAREDIFVFEITSDASSRKTPSPTFPTPASSSHGSDDPLVRPPDPRTRIDFLLSELIQRGFRPLSVSGCMTNG